jgi:hypothetical protein
MGSALKAGLKSPDATLKTRRPTLLPKQHIESGKTAEPVADNRTRDDFDLFVIVRVNSWIVLWSGKTVDPRNHTKPHKAPKWSVANPGKLRHRGSLLNCLPTAENDETAGQPHLARRGVQFGSHLIEARSQIRLSGYNPILAIDLFSVDDREQYIAA